ncbi:MAG: DUF362 domain-containing protein [Deltaproteobacteria bacterium]|nr:DUF362 domain-containing protein [Deltaproteobacteria bacterium]
MSPKIAIQKASTYNPEEVYNAIKAAIDLLGGMSFFVKEGERILIKPNLLSAKPPEAAITTHPSGVGAGIRLVKEAGANPFVGDSPGVGGALRVATRAGILEVCQEMGVEVVDFTESIELDNPKGKTFKRLQVAREVVEADGVINLPKLKTHTQMLLTLCVKNMFGCVVGKRKPQWHLAAGVDRDAFARMLVDLYLLLQPRLTIVDGVVGMEGNGPGTSGDPRSIGLIFASLDCIAMDAVITEVLGMKAEALFTTRVARADGLGETMLERIGVLGERVEDVRIKDFKFPALEGVMWELGMPDTVEAYLRKTLTPRPFIEHERCTLCRLCIEVCPPKVMSLVEGTIEIDHDGCIRCFCCQEMCPEGAITVKEGWISKLLVR